MDNGLSQTQHKILGDSVRKKHKNFLQNKHMYIGVATSCPVISLWYNGLYHLSAQTNNSPIFGKWMK